MTHSSTLLVTSSLALALICGAAQAQPAAKPMITLQMPATPEPARVTLDPKTTALIVLDYVEDICAKQPTCTGQMLPAQASACAAGAARSLTCSRLIPESTSKLTPGLHTGQLASRS